MQLLGMVMLVAVASVAYGLWSEPLLTNVVVQTGELDWQFVPGSLILLDSCDYVGPPGYDYNASLLPSPGAYQLDKDVACTRAEFADTDGDGDYDGLTITIENAYPWYYTHVAFKVHNNGDIPLKIWRIILDGQEYYELNEQVLQQGVEIDVTDDGEPDILLWWGDNFGTQLHPCNSADISLDITVLQEAPEGATLQITISFQAIAWNEYESATP